MRKYGRYRPPREGFAMTEIVCTVVLDEQERYPITERNRPYGGPAAPGLAGGRQGRPAHTDRVCTLTRPPSPRAAADGS